jgi:purine-binding chemotaxis protein CheW
MTQVPLAPAVIEGLINLRGQIVTAVDMRGRLKLRPRAAGQTPMNTVVRTKEGAAVSLLVDEIGDVVEVDSETFEPVPDNVDPAARDLLQGVYKLKDRLLLVLDTEKTIDILPPMRDVGRAILPAAGFSAGSGRLKGGCGQDWPPYNRGF